MSRVLAVGVHDPRHRLLVGAQIRRRDVAIGPDEVDDLRGVAPGDPLHLGATQAVGVHADAPLGASEGQSNDGALPGHQHGQRRYLAQVDVGGVPDASLGGTHGEQVLHAVTEEGVHFRVVVAAEGEGDHEGPLWLDQPLADVLVEVHGFGDPLELGHGFPVHRGIPLPGWPCVHGPHRLPPRRSQSNHQGQWRIASGSAR